MPTTEEIITRLTIEADARGIGETTRELMGLARAQDEAARSAGGIGRASATAGDAFESAAKKADNLRSRLDPTFRAMQAYRKDAADLSLAIKSGNVNYDEAILRLGQMKDRLDRLSGKAPVQELTEVRGAMKLTGQEAFQVGQQVQDFFIQVSSGQGVLIPLVQQGSQLTAVMGGTDRALQLVRSVLTPTNIAFAAGAVAVGTAVEAYRDYLTSSKAVEVAVSGIGRSAGVTAAALNASTAAYASAAGISIRETRGLETVLLRTGRIGGEAFAPMIAMTKDFAATIGTSNEEAGKTLADLVARPAEGARQLVEQYRLLDPATARRISQLVDENREMEAQQMLIDALPARLASAEQATTALGRAWTSVTNAASNAYDAIGKAIDKTLSGPSLQDQVAALDAQISRQRGDTRSRATGNVDDLIAQRDALQGLIDIQNETAKLRAREEEDIRKGEFGLSTARKSPANSDSERLRELRTRLTAMQEGIRSPSLMPDERVQLEAGINAAARALSTYIPEAQRAAQIDELDRKIAEERNIVRRADLVARREALSLAGQEIMTTKEQALVEAARNKVIQDSASAVKIRANEQVIQSRNAYDTAGLQGYARAMAELNARYEDQIRLAGGNADALNALSTARRAEVEAMTRDAVLNPLMSRVDSVNDRISLLQVQRDTFGQTADKIAEAQSRQQQLNYWIAQGVPITKSLSDAVGEVAKKNGEAALAAQELADKQKEVVDAMDAARDFSNDSLGGLLKDLSRGKNPLEGLINAGHRFADRLIDQGVESFTQNFLGRQGTGEKAPAWLTALVGADKSKIPGLLDKSMIASSIQITAASVVVSGGISMSGLGGLPGMGSNGVPIPTPRPYSASSGNPPIPGLAQSNRQGFGLPPIPGLMRDAAKPNSYVDGNFDPSDVVEVVDAGRGFTTVKLADGSIFKQIGARNWRNNNPGNIEYGKFARSQGAVGTDGRFAVFPDYESGRAAKSALLFESQAYRDRTIQGAINRYAPPFENNTNAYASQVASATGVPLDTPLSALTPMQRNAMLDAMQRVEGFRPGQSLQIGAGQPIDMLGQKFQAVIPPLQQMPSVLNAMSAATKNAGGALGQLPNIIGQIGGGGGGGGLFGFLGGLFGGGSPGPTGGLYAEGGIATRPSIFGEAGPEAAVPLSRGRYIPVEMRSRAQAPKNNMMRVNNVRGGDVTVIMNGNSEADRKYLEDRLQRHQYDTMKMIAEQDDDRRSNSWRRRDN